MSRRRFALLVALLAVLVATVSFAAALQVLDDGKPDPPPRSDTVDASDTTLPGAPTSTTSTTTTSPVVAAPGELATPAWVAIVASEDTQGLAEDAAAEAAAEGHPAGVLRSSDYPSLSRGLWVAYVGPYPDAAAAEAAVTALDADGITGTYVRCVGTKKECGSDEGGHDD